MSGTGESSAFFAGEERAFRIRLGEIRRIQTKCDAGIGEVLRRLSRAVYVTSRVGGVEALASGIEIHADDVRETIYQGLIGADVPAPEAARLVVREIDDRGVRGLLDNVGTALSVLWGSQATPPGEPPAGESQSTPPNPSTSQTSTE